MSKAFVIKNKEGEYFDGDSAFGNLIYTDDLSYAEIYTPNERKRISDNDLKRNGEYFAEVYISEVNLEEENRVLKKRQNDFCDIVVSTIEVWLQQEGFYAEEFEDLFDLIRELKWNEN